MAGRNRKVVDISTGKIGKAARKERAVQEKKIKLDRQQLQAPGWLDEIAKKEFLRVVEEAGSIELWDNLDLGILAIYANAYSRYQNNAEDVLREGDTIERVTAYDSYDVVNPKTVAAEKYAKIIMQCSTKLGLATTDRLKLIVPVKEDKAVNKYIKYMEKDGG